jgi:hypothetical protein
MKKLLIFLFLLFIVGGCGSDNTPKKEVQKLFSNYNNLSSDLLIQLDSVMESENLTEEQIVKYKEVLKRQYEDLKYKINDEIISQDNAVVSTEVEVYNLVKVIDDAEEYLKNNKDKFYNEEKLDNKKFWDYKLDKMLETTERINYTVDFSLTKLDGKWTLDELLEIDRQKIHGLYK